MRNKNNHSPFLAFSDIEDVQSYSLALTNQKTGKVKSKGSLSKGRELSRDIQKAKNTKISNPKKSILPLNMGMEIHSEQSLCSLNLNNQSLELAKNLKILE